jgi:hypothetical protein
MVRLLMNYEGFGRKGLFCNRGIVQKISSNDPVTSLETSAKVTSYLYYSAGWEISNIMTYFIATVTEY